MEPVFCYESVNGSCLRAVYPLAIRITLYMILGIIVTLTVFGNFLVIASIAYFMQLHTPTNYLICSLAVTDLLIGLIVMPPSVNLFVETCWYFGDVFCKICMSFSVTLCTASILNLLCISVDRYYAVCHPLIYSRKITANVVLIMILISWSVSIMTGFGMIYLELNILGIEEFYYTHVSCVGGCILLQTRMSSTVSSMLSFYIPGIVMISIYLRIFVVAKGQSQRIHVTAKMSSTGQNKATKTLAIIMGTFLSFWMVFFLINTIDPFIGYSVPPVVYATLLWIGYLNSTVNPLIYAFFYSWFKKAFRLLISVNIFKSDISKMTLFSE